MQQYLKEEEAAAEAAKRFTAAFGGIKNAVVRKSQKNMFGLYVKYPLFVALCLGAIAAVFILQFAFSLFDAMYIVCEIILAAGLVFVSAVLLRTWAVVIRNATLAEEIVYYNGGVKCMVTSVSGGGKKVEWEDASLYLHNDDFELIESKTKQYNPLFYKKIHGHSRGFAFFDAGALVSTFFDGANVVSDNNGETVMSTGFKFKTEYGVLKYIEVTGFYDECYENNFPIMTISAQSKSYTFRYEFSDVNVPNFRLILPDRTKEGAKLFFLTLPADKNIYIN